MKSTILSAVFILILGKAVSQKPMPTYTENPMWKMIYTGAFSSDCSAINIFLKPDTFICGRNYSPIARRSFAKCEVSAYFRQSGNKVYIRSAFAPDCSSADQLEYDFGLNIGDTTICSHEFGDSTKFWVADKAYVMYEGVSRLTFTMNYYYYGNIIGEMKWIYGVGSNVHPFHSLACLGPECEEDQQLVKATVNEVLTYEDTVLSFSCWKWVGIKENSSASELKLYPTSARDEINFEFDNEAEFGIRNILGQNILSGKTRAGVGKLNISTLNPGLYLFTLKSGNSFYTARFIKE